MSKTLASRRPYERPARSEKPHACSEIESGAAGVNLGHSYRHLQMSERTDAGAAASYDKSVTLVLQGGGALGSDQAGAYEARAERPAEGRKREVRRAMQSAPAGRRRWKLVSDRERPCDAASKFWRRPT
jgi:hypothetical protein